MMTRLEEFAFGPSERRERHGTASEKQSAIKTGAFFAQIDRRIIVRCLSVFGDVKTKFTHRPLFQPVGWIARFSSFTRDQFVPGSHDGCMSADIRLAPGASPDSSEKAVLDIRKRAESSSATILLFYFALLFFCKRVPGFSNYRPSSLLTIRNCPLEFSALALTIRSYLLLRPPADPEFTEKDSSRSTPAQDRRAQQPIVI